MGYRMVVPSVFASLLVFPLLLHADPITFKDGGYDDVVVSIADNVPAHDCRNVLEKLEVSFYATPVQGQKRPYSCESCKLYITSSPKSCKSFRR